MDHTQVSANQNLTSGTYAPGTIIGGRYEIQALAGKGGMGLVYKARHRDLNRIVALKVLHARLIQDQRSRDRFKQEARAAAALSHPHLTTVFDCGQTNDGAPFFVMDFIDGQTVGDVLKRNGRLSVARALKIGVQVAEALDYAHQRGIVHRDIKPANVMLLRGHEDDFALVLDFGIARVVQPEGEEALRLTKTGEVFGSPTYMSPEQCMGSQLDGRSDMYSFGCMLFEMVTGKLPFRGENTVQTIVKHINEPAPVASSVAPEAEIPPALDALITRCLEKQPDARYVTMRDVAAALRAVPSAVPQVQESARSYTPIESRQRPNRRVWIQLTAGAAVAAGAVLAMLTFAGLHYFRTPQPTKMTPIESAGSGNTPQSVGKSDQQGADQQTPGQIEQSPWSYVKVTNPAVPGKPRVHLISVYMGAGGKDSSDYSHRSHVDVDVTAKDAGILVLNAYAPVVWTLHLGSGANVRKIVACGYHEQEVRGARGIPIVKSSYDTASGGRNRNQPFEFFYALPLVHDEAELRKSGDYKKLCDGVQSATGLPPTTVQVQYMRSRFVVD